MAMHGIGLLGSTISENNSTFICGTSGQLRARQKRQAALESPSSAIILDGRWHFWSATQENIGLKYHFHIPQRVSCYSPCLKFIVSSGLPLRESNTICMPNFNCVYLYYILA